MKISEMNTTLPEFMSEINRVIRENKVYGAAIVLFTKDGECHSYAFGCEQQDFAIASDLMSEYVSLCGEAN
jgi:hypothetical protein